MATILALHHKHIELVKLFAPHVFAQSARKGFNQSIRRPKGQKASLQCLASAMLKSVMPSVGPFKVIKVIFLSVLQAAMKRFFKQKFHSYEVYNKSYKVIKSDIFHVRS